jgi:hypothetical protein
MFQYYLDCSNKCQTAEGESRYHHANLPLNDDDEKYTPSTPLPAAAANDNDNDNNNDNDADVGMVVEVPPNRQTYNVLIQYCACTSPPAITKAFLEKMRATSGYKKPDVDLLTATVASCERNQQPFKALNLMKTYPNFIPRTALSSIKSITKNSFARTLSFQPQ